MKILLKEIRLRKGFSLRQVEYMTGIPRSTLFDIESKGVMTFEEAEKIAKGLHIRITDLFESQYK